ncbi:Amino-acid acetyltransferase, mitochondrial [Thoreauomyces humboldtii]|nr:Amino-acid acetyltransferase, mitochondrial [Thoreauomyces humboldtii]
MFRINAASFRPITFAKMHAMRLPAISPMRPEPIWVCPSRSFKPKPGLDTEASGSLPRGPIALPKATHSHHPRSQHQPPRTVTHDRQLILDILGTMPSQREARQFLKRFNQVPDGPGGSPLDPHYRDLLRPVAYPSRDDDDHDVPGGASASVTAAQHQKNGQLGLIALQDSVPRDKLRLFAGTLVQLQKLGLTPIVVVETAPPLPSQGGEPGRPPRRKGKDPVLGKLFEVANLIEESGGRSMALYTGVFSHISEANPGTVTPGTDLRSVHLAVGLGQIPVIATFSYTRDTHRKTNIPCHQALVSLSTALARDPLLKTPLKTILVNHRGGLGVSPAEPISFVNMEDEFREVRADLAGALETTCTDDDDRTTALLSQLRELDMARGILNVLPSSSSAIITSVTSSAALISNLITDKPLNATSLQSMPLDIIPSGRDHSDSHHYSSSRSPSSSSRVRVSLPTVLRHGLSVVTHKDLSTIDEERLTHLLDQSFRKTLVSRPYYERLADSLDRVIVAGDGYDGAAIVTYERDPLHLTTISNTPTTTASSSSTSSSSSLLPYLDKFAVAPTSQGIGVADILWKHVRKHHPTLSWRSRASNPVNKWYFDRSDGNLRLKGSQWVLFWYGEGAVEKLASYEAMVRNVPASFQNPG